MEIEVSVGNGKKIEAKLETHTVRCDQPESSGGENSAPSPFDYFFISTALCAGHYARSFCDSRNISTEGLKIIQSDEKLGDEKYKKKIYLKIKLPLNFPEKYYEAIVRSVEQCTVKKVIQAIPEFEVSVL